MSDIEFLLSLLAVVALAAWLTSTVGVPYPILLVVVGAGLGYIPGLPEPRLDPDVVFLVFIPPLVHAAAYTTPLRQLRQQAGAIVHLALGLVPATMVAVAVVAHDVVGMSWPAAFVLGAVVSPTDPVAATAVFRRLGAPPRVVTLVEGESLINDASGLVAYRIAVTAAVTGAFSLGDGVLEFVTVSIGGAAVGYVAATLIARILRQLDDPLIEITLTLLTPYVSYIAAEELGVSGILAAVVTGLWLGARSAELFAPTTRLEANAFWSVLTFLLESTLFVLVGLQFPSVIAALRPASAGTLAGEAAAVVGVIVVVRLLWVILFNANLPIGQRVVIGWSGMRGAISLAAALAVPDTVPGRDLIVFLALAVIGGTLVTQGLTLPAVARAARLEHQKPDARQYALTRFRTVQAALDRIGELSFRDDMPRDAVERARAMYTQRARQLAGECREGGAGGGGPEGDAARWLELRRELLEVERAELHALYEQGEISRPVMESVERELDLEASRLMARQRAAQPGERGA